MKGHAQILYEEYIKAMKETELEAEFMDWDELPREKKVIWDKVSQRFQRALYIVN